MSVSTYTLGSEVIAVTRTAVDRFTDPLYTRAEVARFLGITDTTLTRWVKPAQARRARRSEGRRCARLLHRKR